MFGSCLGKSRISKLMMEHSFARKHFSPRQRRVMSEVGHLLLKFYGYPLSASGRMRARAILRFLQPQIGEKILDAGCGIGWFCFELATRYKCRVFGIDLDDEDIALANRIKTAMNLTTVHFFVQDLNALAFPTAFFDKIIMSEVLEHIENDQTVLEELNRVLKPSGRLIISVPYIPQVQSRAHCCETFNIQRLVGCKPFRLDDASAHVRDGYSVEGIIQLAACAGFEVQIDKTVVKSFTALGTKMGMLAFPIAYPLSFLDAFVGKEGSVLVADLRKKSTNLSEG